MEVQWAQLGMTVVFPAFTLWPDAAVDGMLAADAEMHAATVTVNGLMHNTCKYTYALGGQSFTGKGYACGQHVVGDALEIYYSPYLKGVSSNRKPGSEYPTALILSVIALPFAAFFRKRTRAGT